ncbi:MAG: hypothetical protein C0518_00120 [Opitutus sp.]|nr:hypothetical protein [Opitutus sp.]
MQQWGSRLRLHWLIKMIGTTGGIAVFFCIYFWLLRHPIRPVTVMPLLPGDDAIPFQPALLPFYFSLWFYISLPVALLNTRRELASHGLAAVVLSVAGFSVFLLWPTVVPARTADWSLHPSWSFLQEIDAAGNACPSLHVAFAQLAAVWLHRVLRQMDAGRTALLLNQLWCGAIVYSTLATRQHVLLDVLSGAALGGVVAAAHVRCLRTRANQLDASCAAVGTTHL